MISWRVRPPRGDLPGGNARLSWTWIITWGRPKCRRRPSGVWCGGNISTRRRARGCCQSWTRAEQGLSGSGCSGVWGWLWWALGSAQVAWSVSGRAGDQATAAAARLVMVMDCGDAWLAYVTRSGPKTAWNGKGELPSTDSSLAAPGYEVAWACRGTWWCRDWKEILIRTGRWAPAGNAWRRVKSPTGHSCRPRNAQSWLPPAPWLTLL